MKTLTTTEMENVQAGMPCWVAKIGLIAAGIAFVATVGQCWPILAAAVLGLGVSEYGLLESCFPELMS